MLLSNNEVYQSKDKLIFISFRVSSRNGIVEYIHFVKGTSSETFGDWTTEKVSIIMYGYYSLIFYIRRVPIPDPVSPLNERVIWKP